MEKKKNPRLQWFHRNPKQIVNTHMCVGSALHQSNCARSRMYRDQFL